MKTFVNNHYYSEPLYSKLNIRENYIEQHVDILLNDFQRKMILNQQNTNKPTKKEIIIYSNPNDNAYE